MSYFNGERISDDPEYSDKDIIRKNPDYKNHPNKDVELALLRLGDALCSWERATGRRSLLILKEEGGFIRSLDSGKPFDSEGIPVENIFEQVT